MNKTALVTGAGVGIGRGIALELAKAGYDVAIHYFSNEKKAEELKRQITSFGVKSALIQADLTSDEGPEKLMHEFGKHFTTLDVFVNNSGITITAPFLKTTRETFDSMCSLNLRGAYFCIQEAAKYFIEKK